MPDCASQKTYPFEGKWKNKSVWIRNIPKQLSKSLRKEGILWYLVTSCMSHPSTSMLACSHRTSSLRESLVFGGGIPGKNWEMQDCIVGRHMNSFSYVFLHCWAVPVPPFPPVSQQDLVVVTEVSGTERTQLTTIEVDPGLNTFLFFSAPLWLKLFWFKCPVVEFHKRGYVP